MNQDEDSKLIKRLKKDDESAFRTIYDRYHEAIYGIAVKYLKSKSLAEDTVHDIFIKLWDYRYQLDEQKSLKNFLLTSAKNHVLNMIRDRKREIERNMDHSHLKPISQNKTTSGLTLENYKKVFRRALKKLPAGKKEIFEMKMREGISNQRIAEELDVSVNTVKSQYYKASQFIKEYLSTHTELEFE